MAKIQVPKATQLPSGRWRCRVTIGGKKPSYTADTPYEAEELARQAVAEYKAGVLKQKENAETVESCIIRFIEDRKSILSPSTIRGYNIVKKNRFQSMMQLDIHSITQQQWQAAVNAEARTVSAKTIKNAWGLMSSVIKDATGTAPAVRLPAVDKNTRPFLDDQQVKVFLEAIKETNIEAAALLGLHSLRCSEIMALTWSSIDTKKGTISVKGAMVPDENNIMVYRKQNKTAASQRTVPIFIPRLKELAEGKNPEDRVVTITVNWLYKSINEICEKNDLPKIGIHGLRHTFASICYPDIPEKQVMELGGWSDSATLKKIYTHLSQKKKDAYIDKLEGKFKA